MMYGNVREYQEANRLACKFFPLATAFVTDATGLDWEAFVGAMQLGDYHADYSCDPFHTADSPVSRFAEMGGTQGSPSETYARLLRLTGYTPQGRAVVVPDAIGANGWTKEDCLPFVCDAGMVPIRLDELNLFDCSRDTLFVFESGAAIVVDHDERVHWARPYAK